MRKISEASIFISHSSEDLWEVRKIRDYLEANDTQPLLFFLKCLSDESELEDLLKREILARNFFLLCDSPNAQRSKYVQQEIEFVKKQSGKPYQEINLSDDWKRQVQLIDEFLPKTKIFPSYAHADNNRAEPYLSFLKKHDFGIFIDTDIKCGVSWQETVSQEITAAAINGYMIHFLSKASIESKFVQVELEQFLTLEDKGNMIPVMLDPILDALPPIISQYQILDFSVGNIEDHFHILLKALGVR